MSKKKVTILALHLHYGGVEKYLSSLCAMLEADYTIDLVVTYRIQKEPAFPFSDQVHIRYLMEEGPNKQAFKDALKAHRWFKVICEGLQSVRILYERRKRNIQAIRQIESDYIITTRPFHSRLVGRYASQTCIKIATEHNDRPDDQRYTRSLVRSLRGFDALVCVSPFMVDYYAKRIQPTVCVCLPNVLDHLPTEMTATTMPVLISVGRLEPEKDPFALLTILKQVKKTIPDVRLYIIGDGSLKTALKAKIQTEHLTKQVVLTGYLDSAAIAEYMKKSQLFVLTSKSESFGLVLLEAMSYHLACVAFADAKGARLQLADGAGILINEHDPQQMAEAIIDLLQDSHKRQQVAQQGYRACQKYLASEVRQQWLAFLKDLAK